MQNYTKGLKMRDIQFVYTAWCFTGPTTYKNKHSMPKWLPNACLAEFIFNHDIKRVCPITLNLFIYFFYLPIYLSVGLKKLLNL